MDREICGKRSVANKRCVKGGNISCVSKTDDIDRLMHRHILKGKVKSNTITLYGRHTSSICLCFVVISIPLSFIYIGYAIGALFMPPPPRIPAPGVVMDMAQLNYSWYNTHNLTIAFAGGLGNQMFQYAALYGISKANGFKPIVCDRTTIGRIFRLLKSRRTDSDISQLTKSYSIYSERKSNAFDRSALSLNFMRNIVLDGYFQSWRYFDHVRSDMKRQFHLRSSTVDAVNSFLHDSVKLSDGTVEPTFVGIHIRRGDLLEAHNENMGYTVADASYLSRAMRYFEKKYERLIFVICSDDMTWSTANVHSGHSNSALVFSHFSSVSPEFDLAVLAHCNHSIITVGTFGWWGAWLAGGETIYYRDYPRHDSNLWNNFRFGDYYLPTWIAM